MAKIVRPETELPENGHDALPPIETERPSSIIMAAGEGAQTGLKIAASIGAMLLAFAGIVALLNGMLGAVGGMFGMADLTFQKVLGYLFAPLMMLLNLSWDEARIAGGLFGEKLILNEFVAYIDFAKIQATLSAHAQLVITFALCGFANLGSIAIQLAVIGGISPEKREFVAQNGPRALLAASLANLLNAAVAGLVFMV
jgi:CNT family concentrative nucleoside transporter